jgi:hypothetical protein
MSTLRPQSVLVLRFEQEVRRPGVSSSCRLFSKTTPNLLLSCVKDLDAL